ncbi:MAG: sigma 54-interacting transcriptional regulator [Proteobacteria bacterium]|nr:sigma 54-interacting transcriptional regulator [Pseudomonadota bacterium]
MPTARKPFRQQYLHALRVGSIFAPAIPARATGDCTHFEFLAGIEQEHRVAYQGEIVGEHPIMVETRRLISKVAKSPTRTVLIYGETGTGKGLVARMLHEESERANGEFIDVNCAAIPANLMESELFGYEKGAFTGALAKKTGLIEAADGGSIFLDEIRELDPVLQAKLLSVLDAQEFRRVGAVRSKKVDTRFIAASNRILWGEVRAGRFRDDLYYRLQVVAINVPPLRERGKDVLVLAEYFMRKFSARYGRSIRDMEPAVRDVFLAYRWPGNVRELENLLERIFILEEDNRILVRHVPPRIMRELDGGTSSVEEEHGFGEGFPLDAKSAETLDFHTRTRAFQRRMVERALADKGGVSGAAGALGISRHALRHQMKKLGL